MAVESEIDQETRELTKEQQNAAALLGFDQGMWEDGVEAAARLNHRITFDRKRTWQ